MYVKDCESLVSGLMLDQRLRPANTSRGKRPPTSSQERTPRRLRVNKSRESPGALPLRQALAATEVEERERDRRRGMVPMTCELCGKALNTEESAAESKLCAECTHLINCDTPREKRSPSGKTSGKATVALWLTGCVILTVLGSYNLSDAVLSIFNLSSAGFVGNLVECSLSIVPALLTFFAVYIGLRSKCDPFLRGAIGAASGIVVACVAAILLRLA
jgi:hypothetical protein